MDWPSAACHTWKTARFPKELGYHAQFKRNGPSRMYHTTGFTNDDIVELCAMVESAELEADVNHWPPILGLFNGSTPLSVVAVL
jgi:hypothetical protein